MGAALVLDSPNDQFQSRHLKFNKQIPGPSFPEFDAETIKRKKAVFEKLCKDRCLELAAKATAIDGADVELWRLRALLLFRESTPRDPRWLDILEECTQHDPDNAIYDYLTANYYWETGAELDFAGDDLTFIVKDASLFRKGIECFERGQAKPYCSVGDAGFTAAEDFLARSGLPVSEHPLVVGSRNIHVRRSVLFRDVWRWQGARSTEKAAAGDIEAALAMERQNLHLCGQFAAEGPSTAYDLTTAFFKLATTDALKSFAEKHQEALGAAEVERIALLNESAKIDKMVIGKAANLLPQNRNRTSTGWEWISAVNSWGLLSGIFVNFTPSFVVLLLFIGALATVLTRGLPKDEIPVVGPIGHIAAFLAAMIVSFVFFGLAPAEIIGQKAQSWIFTIGLLLLPLGVVLLIGWIWLRRRAFQYTIRTLLIGTLVFYLACGLLAALSPLLMEFPFKLWIPARGWGGLDLAFLEPVKQQYGNWCWAILQWRSVRRCLHNPCDLGGIDNVCLRL